MNACETLTEARRMPIEGDFHQEEAIIHDRMLIDRNHYICGLNLKTRVGASCLRDRSFMFVVTNNARELPNR